MTTDLTLESGRDPAVDGKGENARTALRRLQILNAAEACFRQHGFHATSMAEIAKSFGMSAGNIYRFFDSKDAIIFALIERDLEEVRDSLSALEGESDVVDALTHELEACVMTMSEQAPLRLEILAEASRNPKVAERMRHIDTLIRDRLRDILLPSTGVGGALADRDELARIEILMALFDGLITRALRNPDINLPAMTKVLRSVIGQLLQRSA